MSNLAYIRFCSGLWSTCREFYSSWCSASWVWRCIQSAHSTLTGHNVVCAAPWRGLLESAWHAPKETIRGRGEGEGLACSISPHFALSGMANRFLARLVQRSEVLFDAQ